MIKLFLLLLMGILIYYAITATQDNNHGSANVFGNEIYHAPDHSRQSVKEAFTSESPPINTPATIGLATVAPATVGLTTGRHNGSVPPDSENIRMVNLGESDHDRVIYSGNGNTSVVSPASAFVGKSANNSKVSMPEKIDICEESGNDGKNCSGESNTCQTGKCNVNGSLYPIFNPAFNMREVAKQCLLLEDHLNNTQKRCLDCIKKHFLIIDGLLEEAISLEKDNITRKHYRSMHIEWVKMEKEYSLKSSDPDTIDNVSKKIRQFRKPLVENYFDTVSNYDMPD